MKPVVLVGARNPRSLWGRFTQVVLNLHSPSLGYVKDCWCWKCWTTTCDSTCMCGWKSGPCNTYTDAMNKLDDHQARSCIRR